ncbi:MAG: hypothetical protein PHU56_02495 [Candidatus Pacebacteria bacterium]|nr:hypothetical protein [Candidatus Paceibacterota bacterium]
MFDYFGEGDNWQAEGLIVFLKIWGWLLIPLVVFLFLGKWLESKMPLLAPWPFIASMGVGFFVTMFGILKETLILWKKVNGFKTSGGQPVKKDKDTDVSNTSN